MPKKYGKVMRQANKPNDKIRMFHGSPNKITNGIIEPRFVNNETMGFEDPGGMHAAFATSDIYAAATYAGPKGHIYELHEKPDEMNTDWGGSHGDLAHSDGAPLHIKQEVGHPGRNIARMQHFSTGHDESRK
jgi:hypothetical protein